MTVVDGKSSEEEAISELVRALKCSDQHWATTASDQLSRSL